MAHADDTLPAAPEALVVVDAAAAPPPSWLDAVLPPAASILDLQPAGPAALPSDSARGVRFARRSSELTLYMRKCKEASRSARRLEEVHSQLEPIRDVWNRSNGLRQGDQLVVRDDDKALQLTSGSQRWDFERPLRLGFSIGANLRGSGFGQTHRQLETIEAVAGLALSMQADAVRLFVRRVGTLGPREGPTDLAVLRNHDASPIRVAFGRLAAGLDPHVRYFTPAPKWSLESG